MPLSLKTPEGMESSSVQLADKSLLESYAADIALPSTSAKIATPNMNVTADQDSDTSSDFGNDMLPEAGEAGVVPWWRIELERDDKRNRSHPYQGSLKKKLLAFINRTSTAQDVADGTNKLLPPTLRIRMTPTNQLALPAYAAFLPSAAATPRGDLLGHSLKFTRQISAAGTATGQDSIEGQLEQEGATEVLQQDEVVDTNVDEDWDMDNAVLPDTGIVAGTIARAAYRSPFRGRLQAAIAAGSPVIWKWRLAAEHDEAVGEYLQSVADEATHAVLNESRVIYDWMRPKFASSPYFRVDAGGAISQITDTPNSLMPAVLSSQYVRRDDLVIPSLQALVIYILSCEGILGPALTSVAADRRRIVYGDLVTEQNGTEPTDAKDISLPGIYLVNPLGRMCLIGMSYAMGIADRTAQYPFAKYPESSRVGQAQAHCSTWPGYRGALMWHDATAPCSPLLVPSGMVYGAESFTIMALGGVEAGDKGLRDDLADCRLPQDADLFDRPPIVLNTNIADTQFRRCSRISRPTAENIVRRVIDVLRNREPFPSYALEKDEEHASNRDAALWYHHKFDDIFPNGCTAAFIYTCIRFRTYLMRLTLAGMDDERRLVTGYWWLLPGKDPIAHVMGKWFVADKN